MEIHDELVNKLYDAALQPEQLPSVLTQITDWIDGDTCHLVGWEPATGQPLLSLSNGLCAGVGEDYAQHYALLDPRRSLGLSFPLCSLISCHEHFDSRYVSHSEFFQDYLLPLGIHYLLGSTLLNNEHHTFIIGFQRYIGHSQFEASQTERLKRLTPHIRRSLTLLLRMGAYRKALAAGEHAIDAFDQGVVALDADFRVIFANARANAILRDGSCLRTIEGRITVANNTAHFLGALERVLMTGLPENLLLKERPTQPLSAKNTSPKNYYLTISRSPSNNQSSHRSIDPCEALIMLITSPDRQRSVTARQLMQFFNLTPAEAGLAHALCCGETLETYRQSYEVKDSTVRSQLRAILGKTGVGRQQDLVRLLASLPSVRLPNT